MHSNDGAQLSGGIYDGEECQKRWRTLAVMPARRYDAPSGRVGRRFMYTLAVELTGVRPRHWNTERFIVFKTVILQRSRQVTRSGAIRRRIDCRLDAWESGEFGILAEDTAHTCA